MLKICNATLNFLNELIDGDYAYLALVILLFSCFAVFIIEAAIVIKKRVQRDCGYFLCFGLIALILSFVFSFKDFFADKKLISSGSALVVYLSLFAILVLILFVILKGLSAALCFKKVSKQHTVVEQKPIIEPPIEYFVANKKLESDYLNVSYVKELIYKLKQQELSVEDANELEEFEVYLLNFACRQPYSTEKDRLSNYLSSLIKKLAKSLDNN